MSQVRQLQLAIDTTSTADAVKIAQELYPYYDIVELGTPLIIEQGLRALEAVKKKYPDKKYLADTKIADAGYIEASSAFKRGADIVTVLGVSDDATIKNVIEAARQHKGRVMADMLHVQDKPERAAELEQLGVDIICLHTAYDIQGHGVDPLQELSAVRAAVRCSLAIAGGLKLDNIKDALDKGADILVVGGGITKADNPRQTAKRIKEIIAQVQNVE
jgi:3-hexulose-6-phosphate synthase